MTREEVIKYGKEWYAAIESQGYPAGSDALTFLACANLALQERKTGKWVHLPNVWGVVFCSECNYDLRINDTKYCPNCGAKMEDDDGRKPMVDQK